MNEYNELIKRFTAIEDELIRLRKQRNYELNNLDEDNIPKLRQYSQIISENQAAVSLVEQKVSDVESSVTLLSQYTSMDNVVVVESSDDKSAWDTTRVYYDKTAKIYYYYNGEQWLTTSSPVTAGLDTSIAQIQAKADKNESEISLVAKSVTSLGSEVSGQINDLTQNIASVKTTADSASASVSAIVESVGSDGNVTAASIVAKINAAGSSVQIAADHISLKGKTIALTSDSINIESTYFDVSTTGAVDCTSLNVSGSNSYIEIGGGNKGDARLKVYNGDFINEYTSISADGVIVNCPNVNGVLNMANGEFISSATPFGYTRYTIVSDGTLDCYNQFSGSNFFQVIPSANSGTADQVICAANFVCAGAKNRLERTEHYGNRLMYAYETPAPMYADFGRGTIAEDGICVVYLDPLFYECVDNVYEYFVFLQREGGGEIEVTERLPDRFTVTGAPGATFAWMLTAPQKGFVMTRCEEFFEPETEPPQIPNPENAVYDKIGDTILKDYENQLG